MYVARVPGLSIVESLGSKYHRERDVMMEIMKRSSTRQDFQTLDIRNTMSITRSRSAGEVPSLLDSTAPQSNRHVQISPSFDAL